MLNNVSPTTYHEINPYETQDNHNQRLACSQHHLMVFKSMDMGQAQNAISDTI
jgi:hypothetical protein